MSEKVTSIPELFGSMVFTQEQMRQLSLIHISLGEDVQDQAAAVQHLHAGHLRQPFAPGLKQGGNGCRIIGGIPDGLTDVRPVSYTHLASRR